MDKANYVPVLEGIVWVLFSDVGRRGKDECVRASVFIPQPRTLLHIRGKDGRPTQPSSVTTEPKQHILKKKQGLLISGRGLSPYVPLLRCEIDSRIVIVLEETEAVENVHYKSDWGEIHIYPSPRLRGSVAFECHIHMVTYFQLKKRVSDETTMHGPFSDKNF